jgi:hypothetical protein
VKNKRCPFAFEVHIEMTYFGRRKEDHITTSKLKSDAWFQEANISSFTVFIRYCHDNAELLVLHVAMDPSGDVEVDDKATEWVYRRKAISWKNVRILS